MLPTLVSEIPGYRSSIKEQDYVYVQRKLNGWCGMLNTRTRKLYSRSGREITTVPHVTRNIPDNAPEWLHGELYAHGYSLDHIQSMIKRGDERIQFHVFDTVSPLPFGMRYDMVKGLSERMNTVEAYKVPPSHVQTYYEGFLEQGYEGAIIRLDGYPYEHGRSIRIFKMKPGTEVL